MTLRWPCPPGSVGLWCPKSTCQGLDACLPGNAWLAACVPGECRRYISQALSPAPPTLCLRLALAAAEPKHLVQQALVGELRGAHGEFGRGGGSDRGKERSDRHQEVRQGQPKAGPDGACSAKPVACVLSLLCRYSRGLACPEHKQPTPCLHMCAYYCAARATRCQRLHAHARMHHCSAQAGAHTDTHTRAHGCGRRCVKCRERERHTQIHTCVHMGVAMSTVRSSSISVSTPSVPACTCWGSSGAAAGHSLRRHWGICWGGGKAFVEAAVGRQ